MCGMSDIESHRTQFIKRIVEFSDLTDIIVNIILSNVAGVLWNSIGMVLFWIV